MLCSDAWTPVDRSAAYVHNFEESKEARIDKIFFFVTWLLLAILFFSILAVWTEVIYKQVIKGSEGSAIFYIKNRDYNSGSSRQISSEQ